jgi:hypothetical protein
VTRPNLEDLAAKWQKLLRLQDWMVTVEWCKPGEIDGNSGRCSTRPNGKSAWIQVCDPSHVPDGVGFDASVRDPEWIVVHELLHLHLNPCEIDNAHSREEENAIELIAHALIRLDRMVRE